MSRDANQPWSVKLELSAELRLARIRAGKSVDDVVSSGICSQPKLWRLENGVGPWKVADITALALLYGVPTQQRGLLEDMARATGSGDKSWTEENAASSPLRFGLYLRMERRATALTAVTGDLVHGLLQTPAYHRAMLDAWPLGDREAEAAQIQIRQERQAAFWDRKDVRLQVIMAQAALEHRIGSQEVREEQLQRLHSLADEPGVTVGWIPSDSPPHGGMRGNFTVIETPQGLTAYREHFDGGQLLSDPEVVKRFTDAAAEAAAVSRHIREWQ